jgi:hypothetical protein
VKRSAPLQRKTPLRARRQQLKLTERGRSILAGTAPKIPIEIELDQGDQPAPDLTFGRERAAPRATMVTQALTAAFNPAQKPITYVDENWLAAVRTIDCCVLCGAFGVEPAHRNEGKGKGIKVHDCWTAALCRSCHRTIDQGKDMTREQRRAEIDRAIVLTLGKLVLAGKVGVL